METTGNILELLGPIVLFSGMAFGVCLLLVVFSLIVDRLSCTEHEGIKKLDLKQGEKYQMPTLADIATRQKNNCLSDKDCKLLLKGLSLVALALIVDRLFSIDE